MIEFDKIPDEIERVGSQNAPSIAKAKLIKEKLKSILAVITANYMASQDIPVSKAEALARASEEYRKVLAAAEQELQRAEVARSKMKSLELTHEYYRSMNSLEKKKANIL